MKFCKYLWRKSMKYQTTRIPNTHTPIEKLLSKSKAIPSRADYVIQPWLSWLRTLTYLHRHDRHQSEILYHHFLYNFFFLTTRIILHLKSTFLSPVMFHHLPSWALSLTKTIWLTPSTFDEHLPQISRILSRKISQHWPRGGISSY